MFEALEDAGLVTAAVNITCYRGRTRHRPTLPGVTRPALRPEALLLLQPLRVRPDRRAARRAQPLARVDRRLRGRGRPLARHARRLRLLRLLPLRLRLRLARARPGRAEDGARAHRRALVGAARGGRRRRRVPRALRGGPLLRPRADTRSGRPRSSQERFAGVDGRRRDRVEPRRAWSTGCPTRVPTPRSGARARRRRGRRGRAFLEGGEAVARRDGEELRFAAAAGWRRAATRAILDYPDALERAWAALAQSERRRAARLRRAGLRVRRPRRPAPRGRRQPRLARRGRLRGAGAHGRLERCAGTHHRRRAARCSRTSASSRRLRRRSNVPPDRAARWSSISCARAASYDERVLAAMARVPRELFVPPELRARAYEDAALPIGYGQTISQPYMVARICEVLALARERARARRRHRLRLPGRGARRARRRGGHDRAHPGARRAGAEASLEAGLRDRVTSMSATARAGCPSTRRSPRSPSRRPRPSCPTTLYEQLEPRGRMVVPGRRPPASRSPGRSSAAPEGPAVLRTVPCRFVPLLGRGRLRLKRARVRVHGAVQGVGFRCQTRARAAPARARRLGAQPAGRTVEAAFEGDDDLVQSMVDWCGMVQRGARVDDVEVAWEQPTGERGLHGQLVSAD